ncbi:MAG: hypothetical protein IMW90_02850 [Thermogemmatispora sp.]|jgi:hypothetical protein|uniref:Uncharacterized protein n=1 Tax=Thermogemmatispora aurantia TaxID=2045279 RepID=A0A5J4KAJ1_9CHLR|nr:MULTISPECIES: hypothetical protein [Thermogemmatispora]MBE3564647.1 hypothetical protein [Thermogemmatispora sp.]GER83156.1 hypothetical protein KTAU_17930 [Thermogemmatispora aurantia]
MLDDTADHTYRRQDDHLEQESRIMATALLSRGSEVPRHRCPRCREADFSQRSSFSQCRLPESRQDHLSALRAELGASEETEHLIDWLLDMWETIDLLIARFGAARAWQIIATPAALWPQPISSEELGAHLHGEESALADPPTVYP